MDKQLARAYTVEAIGTFALVFFGAGAVCVNHMTTGGAGALLGLQPGLVGIALAQGLILTAVLAATMHLSGGYLNPALTVMLWVCNRLDSRRAAWLVGAQLVGASLAGLCVRLLFEETILREARLGTPHLSALAYPGPALTAATLFSATGVELVLTFFLTFAIFGSILEKARWRSGATGSAGGAAEVPYRTLDARVAALAAGLTTTACVLVGYPLTGAALNPARWFGTVFWEVTFYQAPPGGGPGPMADAFVYIAGPIVGALLAGLVYFRVMLPLQEQQTAESAAPAKTAEAPKASTTQIRAKK
jgi:aquaporin TIP